MIHCPSRAYCNFHNSYILNISPSFPHCLHTTLSALSIPKLLPGLMKLEPTIEELEARSIARASAHFI
ncbi:hypothetical protein BDQ17DRAFT_949195 [Cyathus striatus]|nr:hypothetical protein BDQ17DRAFT_949195 [Cyathus striatus]